MRVARTLVVGSLLATPWINLHSCGPQHLLTRTSKLPLKKALLAPGVCVASWPPSSAALCSSMITQECKDAAPPTPHQLQDPPGS